MTVPRVAVLGGSGKTAQAVAEALRARGASPVPVGRAEWGDLAAALHGVESAYLIAPNLHPDEPAYVDAALAAARAAGVSRVVYHSVAAPYSPSMPHHVGKAVAEDLVRRSGLDWTILQPCAYVQNLLPGLRRRPWVLRVAYSTSTTFGLVDLDDVATAAATVLLADGHHGATYELGGPRLVSVTEVAATAETVLGLPVSVERLSLEEWRLANADLEETSREWLAAMFAYYDAHGLPTGRLPLEALLGRPARGLAQTLRRELG